VSGRNGTYWKDLRRQRETEERDRIDRAIELVTYAREKLATIQEKPEAYSFAMAMNAIAQPQPNAVQTPVPPAKDKPEQKSQEEESP
jgi:type IV secretory pathway VirB10-like protein